MYGLQGFGTGFGLLKRTISIKVIKIEGAQVAEYLSSKIRKYKDKFVLLKTLKIKNP